MKSLMLCLLVCLLAGCGDGSSTANVDTSQAPTQINTTKDSVVYYWGDKSIVYPK